MTDPREVAEKVIEKKRAHSMAVVAWPGLTWLDGWRFGVGFGLFMAIGLPIILGVIGCAFWVVVSILGLSLGGWG